MSSICKISRISGSPEFDSLPVVLIRHYPLEQRDYKPYAQGILCLDDEGLTLRMWAFEVSPLPESSLRCLLYLYEDQRQAYCVDIQSTGAVRAGLWKGSAFVGQDPAPAAAELSGEDLQGVYWGSTVRVPWQQIQAHGPVASTRPGAVFPGNFYKLCPKAPFEHYGSAFPADFPEHPWTVGSMGSLMVTAY